MRGGGRDVRWLYLASHLFQVIMVAGVFFGWSSVAEMLKKEGMYADRCADGLSTCEEQDIAISQFYSIGAVPTYVLSMPIGLLANAFGPKATVIVGAVLAGMGSLTVAFADNSPAAVTVGVVGIASTVPFLLLSSFHVASLFPGAENLVLALLNGGFDLSAIVFRVLLLLYSAGLSLRAVFVGYAVAGPGTLLVLAALTHPARPFEPGPPPSAARTDLEAVTRVSKPRAVHPAGESADEAKGSGLAPSADGAYGADDFAQDTATEDAVDPPAPAPAGSARSSPQPLSSQRSESSSALDSVRQDLSSLLADVRRPVYGAYLLTFCVVFLLFNFSLASVGAHMTSLGDSSGRYVGIFGILLPCGIPAGPAAGAIGDRFGPLASTGAMSALGALVSALRAAPSLTVQVVAFAATGLFRSFLFSANSVFLASAFGLERVGAHVGLITGLGGILVAATVSPLVSLPSSAFSNSYSPVFAGFAVCCGLSLVFPPLAHCRGWLRPPGPTGSIAPAAASTGGAPSAPTTVTGPPSSAGAA